MGSSDHHPPHHHHPVVIHSSILLLQERFRQLERVKKMRQGRDLLRRLWESERYNTSDSSSSTVSDHHHDCDNDHGDESSKTLWFESEILVMPSPPRARQPYCHDLHRKHQNVTLSLWPISQMNMKKEKPCLMLSPSNFITDSESDVDTSLHL